MLIWKIIEACDIIEFKSINIDDVPALIMKILI